MNIKAGVINIFVSTKKPPVVHSDDPTENYHPSLQSPQLNVAF